MRKSWTTDRALSVNHTASQFLKHRSWVLATIVCLVGFAGSAASANNNASDGGSVEAPDFSKREAVWRYRVANQLFTGGSRSNLINGDFEITIMDGRRRIMRLEGDSTVTAERTGPLSLMLPTAAILQNPAHYLDFPLYVGKEWTGKHRVKNHWWDSRNSVTSLETVATMAGTFSAFRIERRITAFYRIINHYYTYVYFYSPQTQSIIKYEFKHEMKDLVGDQIYGLLETVSVELLDYKQQ